MKRFVKTLLHNLLLAFLAFVWLVPIVWLVVTSFSAYTGMNTSTFSRRNGVWRSIRICFFSRQCGTVPELVQEHLHHCMCGMRGLHRFCTDGAYATSCMRFPARKPLMNAAVIVNLFPGVLSMIAVYFILKTLNLTNTHLGLILVYSAGSGLGYLIAKGFFDTIPNSLREAAYLDGASEATIFWRVVIPMSRPIIVYTVISSFLSPWMDFVYAKLMLNAGISSQWTVAIGLYNMLDKSLINTYFGQFCAGGVLVSIPISVLFVIMQKFYVEGITGGAVKG